MPNLLKNFPTPVIQSQSQIWQQAVAEFENQDYFLCHESLEVLWMQAEGEEKQLLQALIQTTVAYHHWHNGNFKGATSILKRAATHLKALKSWPISAAHKAVKEALLALQAQQAPSPGPIEHGWHLL